MKRILAAIVVIAAIGALVAGYGLWQHYAPVGMAICNINEQFSCDIVNKSPWSEVFGIPVAAVGMVGYFVLGGLAIAARRQPMRRDLRTWLFALALVGLAVQVYLTYIELFVIGVACPICLASQAIVLALAVLSGIALRSTFDFRPTEVS